MANVYEIVTDRILASIEAGTVPWRRPWACAEPRNYTSGKAYRGINVLMLGTAGYTSPDWLTFKQAIDAGGNVRKGEKGTPILFWKKTERETETGEKKGGFVLRYYTVFNVEQCEGIKPREDAAPPSGRSLTPIAAAEDIVRNYNGPRIEEGVQAAYSPMRDVVIMPPRATFTEAEGYYSTLFHELGHSTGHQSRLNRDGVVSPIQFGSHAYSHEELVAECCAAFLCGAAGIIDATADQSAAYIAGWSKALRANPKWFVDAASKAAKAADMVRGVKREAYEDAA